MNPNDRKQDLFGGLLMGNKKRRQKILTPLYVFNHTSSRKQKFELSGRYAQIYAISTNLTSKVRSWPASG